MTIEEHEGAAVAHVPFNGGYAKDVYKKAYDTLPAQTQDLKAAKVALKGVTDVPPVVIAYDKSNPDVSKVALSIQSSAKEVGLDLQLRGLSSADFLQVFYDPKAQEGLGGYSVPTYLDFPESLGSDVYFTTDSFYSIAGYSNAEYDKLILEALQTVDDAKRAALTVQAEKIPYDDGYNFPLVSIYTNVFVTSASPG